MSKNTKINILYGKDGYNLNIKKTWEPSIIRKPQMPIIEKINQEVSSAFSNPLGCKSLKSLANKVSSACILVCDITRPVPNNLFIEKLIENLLEGGIKKEKILILIATGLHRPSTPEEILSIIKSKYVLKNFKIVNHDAKNKEEHRYIGTTTKGNKISLDKRFLDAELKIATGLVEPHFMAGFSGGRKVVAPGIAQEDTIRTLHSARYMENPLSRNCNLINNPVHEDQLEIIKMIGSVYSVNCVIDEARNLSFINFGDIIQSHNAAVKFINSFAIVRTDKKFDTIVTSCAGAPLDSTFYQTVKGMISPLNILKEGGDLIILSECKEGMGSREFIKSQQKLLNKGIEKFLIDISKKQFADIDEWQTEKQIEALKKANVYLYCSGIKKKDKDLVLTNLTTNPELTIDESIDKHKNNKIAIIPEGPYVVPIYAKFS